MGLEIEDIPEREIVEIEGIRYSYNFFLDFSKALNSGITFRFVKRENGVVTISWLKKKYRKKDKPWV